MKLNLLLKTNSLKEPSSEKLISSSSPDVGTKKPNTRIQCSVLNLVSPGRINKPKRKSHLFGYLFKNLMIKCTAELLQKNPKERTDQDIKMIDKSIINSQIFNEFAETITGDIRIECCKYIKYKKVLSHTLIQEIDSRVEHLYFLISGKVQQIEILSTPVETKRKIVKEKQTERITVLDSNEKQKDEAIISFPNREFITHNMCKSKYETTEDSVFAVLSRKDFDQIISNTQSKDIFSEISALSRISFFSKWKVNAIKHIIQNSTTQVFKINQMVFDQNSSPDNWYIIREGEFRLERHLEIEVNHKVVQNDMMIQYKQLKQFSTTQSISILQKNEFFGIEDIIQNRKRQYSVKCLSEVGKLTVISAKEILKLMNKNVIIQIDISEISKEKLRFIDDRIKQIEDQFLQSQIKKIETKSRNISLCQSSTHSNTPRNNMEKILQVEDMLEIQEQFRKLHTADKLILSPEALQEQQEIQTYLKQKGFHSMSTSRQQKPIIESLKPEVKKNDFQIRKLKETVLKRETQLVKKDLLDFYRKMIDDKYDVKKNKANNKGFKNSKVNFFNEKVLIPLQQTQKKKNEMVFRKRLDHFQPNQTFYSQIDSARSPINISSLNQTVKYDQQLSVEQSIEQSFNRQFSESYSNTPTYKLVDSTISLDSYRVNSYNRKTKNVSQFQSQFSHYVSSQPTNLTEKTSQSINEKVILPANLNSSRNIKNMIINTIKKRSQHTEESNNIFLNYQDRIQKLNSKLHSISVSGPHSVANDFNSSLRCINNNTFSNTFLRSKQREMDLDKYKKKANFFRPI